VNRAAHIAEAVLKMVEFENATLQATYNATIS